MLSLYRGRAPLRSGAFHGRVSMTINLPRDSAPAMRHVVPTRIPIGTRTRRGPRHAPRAVLLAASPAPVAIVTPRRTSSRTSRTSQGAAPLPRHRSWYRAPSRGTLQAVPGCALQNEYPSVKRPRRRAPRTRRRYRADPAKTLIGCEALHRRGAGRADRLGRHRDRRRAARVQAGRIMTGTRQSSGAKNPALG